MRLSTNPNSQRLFLRFFLFLIIIVFCFKAMSASDVPRMLDATLQEVIISNPLTAEIWKVLPYDDGFSALEMDNHRIVLIKDNRVIGQIGKIGNGNGELYYPDNLFIGKDNAFYVNDEGNSRIQILDSKGKYLGGFRVYSKCFGLAANSRGEVFLGQPYLKSLVTVYDSKGKRLRDLGSLINPSEIYGPDYKQFDDTRRIPLNRVRIAIDEEDCVWLAFIHAPLVLKYDKNGALMYKKILDVPNIDLLKKAVWKLADQPYAAMNIDGIQLVLLIKDIAINIKEKQVLLLLADDRIIGLGPEANILYIINTKVKKGSLNSLCVSAAGEIYATIFGSPKLYRLSLLSEK